MSTNTKTPEGFRVKTLRSTSKAKAALKTKRVKSERYNIQIGGSAGAYYGNDLPIGGEIDQTAAAEALMKPTQAERVAALRASHNDGDTAATSLFEANAIAVTDDCLHWSTRMKHALLILAGTAENGDDGIELVDSICAATARKVERKDRDVVRASNEYRRAAESDTETEIGRNQLAEAEDRINDLRDAVERWDAMHQTATAIFETLSGRQWQDRTTGAAVADVTEAAKWEQQIRTMKLMQSTRIYMVGGNDQTSQIKARLERLKQKVGDKLILFTGDGESGFEAATRKHAKDLGIECYGVPLADRNAKDRFFARNRYAFETLKPNGCIVLGGAGVQGNVIELAQRTKTPIDVMVPPAGWAKTADRGLHRTA
jgi:hypothetical protein